ncbi:MAG: ferredoxin family protein [Bacteroidetes bacterium]|nr:ferredoxin family protein [Bacteroidota bacterium]
MAKAKGKIVIDTEKCKGCGVCVVACPQKCISLGDKLNLKGYTFAIQDATNCVGCAACGIICPDAAITVYQIKE